MALPTWTRSKSGNLPVGLAGGWPSLPTAGGGLPHAGHTPCLRRPKGFTLWIPFSMSLLRDNLAAARRQNRLVRESGRGPRTEWPPARRGGTPPRGRADGLGTFGQLRPVGDEKAAGMGAGSGRDGGGRAGQGGKQRQSGRPPATHQPRTLAQVEAQGRIHGPQALGRREFPPIVLTGGRRHDGHVEPVVLHPKNAPVPGPRRPQCRGHVSS